MSKTFKTSVLMRRIKKYELAVRDHEIKGSMHPDDWNDIEKAYIKTKRDLVEYVLEHVLP